MTEAQYMRRAIELAVRGEGWVHPNPMVGAVIVKDGRVIGEGWHKRCGDLHAERNAFASLTESAEGATLYVTLEPCCHYGKTPPCTEAVIENRIAKVVIGSRDPNPKVAGKGAAILRKAGIEVVEDFLREECDAINPIFFHYITEKTPYVIMKYAMTLDGKIATKTGASKWITGEAARNEVQKLRHRCMGIMAGLGTVLADDPLLNCRIPNGRSPVRILCDSHFSIPSDSQIVKTAGEYETILAGAEPSLQDGVIGQDHRNDKWKRLQEAGITLLNVPDRTTGKTDLKKLMRILGEKEIDSVLLEGGGELNEAALRAGIVQEVHAFVAPKIFGGCAKGPVMGRGVETPDEAFRMKLEDISRVGEDVRLIYRKITQSE